MSGVPSGDLGLDVLLGGGFQLVTRLPGKASATVLVRGGAGAGKTLVGLHVALELARALGGDVAVGCVEILPSEYLAQVRAARPELPASSIVALPARPANQFLEGAPRVFCDLLTELDPEAPDLVASLEALARDVATAGGKPVVLIVDSLIEGYGIGASAPRAGADAVMKFAAQGGYGLVLCEETQGGEASPWVFAADTVIELGVEARERGRWLEVRKHRFGPSVSGRHELDLGEAHPAVFPEPHAWMARDVREVLLQHGWEYGTRSMQALDWDEPKPQASQEPQLKGAFVVITSLSWGVARSLAYGLRPSSSGSNNDLVFELDPLVREAVSTDESPVCHVPTVHGPARALRTLVEQFSRSFTQAAARRPPVRRVILGDLELVLLAPDALVWVEAVRVFASLVIASRWGVPVIAFGSSAGAAQTGAPSLLSTYADLQILADAPTHAVASQRWRRQSSRLDWKQPVTSVQLALDNVQRPTGRRPPP